MTRNPTYQLAVVNSHPIQYFAPLYRRLADQADIDLTVYFGSRAGLEVYRDEGFGGESVAWDVPLVDGYDHVFLNNVRSTREPQGFWSLVNPEIVGALWSEKYDAVWIHGHAYATHILGVLGALSARSCLFMRCETHMGLDRSLFRRILRRPVMTGFYRLFDACLAIGSRNAEFYRIHGVPEKKIFSVPYAVNNRRFRRGREMTLEKPRQSRRELDLPPPEIPVVLYLSKLTRRKRPLDLLRALNKVQERCDFRVALAFVGDGPERGRLKRFVDTHGMRDIHFLGFRNQSELPQIYGASDVFVLPSENEPWGLVVNEAMCAGLPIVVSNEVGAAVDLVHEDVNGYRFAVGDVLRLSKALERILKDDTLRQEMGQASLEIIDDWDLEACVRGVRAALRATCSAGA